MVLVSDAPYLMLHVSPRARSTVAETIDMSPVEFVESAPLLLASTSLINIFILLLDAVVVAHAADT